MMITTRGRYGTKILLDLALHRGWVSSRDIARRQEISPIYIKRLITPLVNAGIVRSARGCKGGLFLLKPAEEINLREVIHLLEGSIAPVDCVPDPGLCERSSCCAMRDVWVEVENAVERVLEATTLRDLMRSQEDKETSDAATYSV